MSGSRTPPPKPPKKVTKGKAAPAKDKPAKPKRAARDDGSGRDDRGKRLLDLVVLLLGARHPVSFREIKAQFRAYRTEKDEAGLRAFERDKADLLELGVPLRYISPDDDDSLDEAGYVVDLRRYRLPEIHLSAPEVAALVLAGSVARAAAGTSYAEVVDLALKKLAFDQPAPDSPGGPAVGKNDKVIVHYPRAAQATKLAENLARLEQAVTLHKRLHLRYLSTTTGQPAERVVDPYGLFYRDGSWAVVGWCHLRDAVRTFRLDRITKLEVAPRPKTRDYERPDGFDVRRYAGRSPWTFEIEPAMSVELEARPEAAALGHEDFGDGAVVEPTADGGVRVRLTCANPEYVISRVLAAKGALVVRAPDALRARAADELRKLAAVYQRKP